MAATEDCKPSLAELVQYIKHGDRDKLKSAFEAHPSTKTLKNFKTLIKDAVEVDSETIVILLLESGANENAVLDTAITYDNENIVNLVIDKGANIDEGLYFAVKSQRTNIIDLLLKRGANINTNHKNGNTPLNTAIIQKCDVDFVKFLIENGADCNARNKSNKTALDLLQPLINGKGDVVSKEKLQIIEDLLKRNTSSDSVFPCLQGLPDGLSGYSYQIKLLTLYAVINTRLANSENCEFELATEVENLVPFDDIFLKKIQDGQIKYCRFVQIKQTKKPYQNKIEQFQFFIMLNPEKNIKKHLKANDTIMKLFMKFIDINDCSLYEAVLKEFIYCTNTTFRESSMLCFSSEGTVPDLNVGKQKYQITEHSFLLLEIKFILLSIIVVSKAIDLNEELKSKVIGQMTILNNLIVAQMKNKNKLEETLWPVSIIVEEGLKVFETYLKTQECSESIKDQDFFLCFRKWDDDAIRIRIDDFIAHFSIYTDCPSSNELNDKISEEINDEFKYHNSKLLSVYCVQHLNDWVSSFKNGLGNLFTNEDGKTLFDDLKGLIVKEFRESYIEVLQKNKIYFSHDNKILLEFIKSTNLKILHVVTEHAHLNAMKILQTFIRFENQELYYDKVIFLTAEFLFTSKYISNVLDAFSSEVNYDILCVDFSDDSQDYDTFYDVLDELRFILKSNTKKKIIIIAKSDNRLAAQLKRLLKKHNSYSEPIGFKDLALESQNNVLDKTVCFCEDVLISPGKELKLKDLLNFDSACKIIGAELLTTLITKVDKLAVGNAKAFNSEAYNIEYYISRKILVIDTKGIKEVLKKLENNIIVITGITKNELISIGDVREYFIYVWDEGDNLKSLDLGITLIRLSEFDGISEPSHNDSVETVFTFISNKCSKAIHWLEFKDNLFFCKDSKNYQPNNAFLGIIEKYSISPEDLEQKVVILANHPGEGKSTMLTGLAHALKTRHPELWIQRINLKDYAYGDASPSLDEIVFCEDDSSKAVDMILRMVVQGDDNNLERVLLELALNGSGEKRIVLLFDGFDEISPDYKEKTCILLKCLKNTNVRQLWVTTRIQMKTYLEEHLQTPACMLAPLTEIQQVNFLNRFWKWRLKNYKDGENCIEIIIENLKICYREYFNLMHNPHVRPSNSIFHSLENIVEHEPQISLSRLPEDIIDNVLNLSMCANLSLMKFKTSIRDKDDFSRVPLNLKMLAENIIENKWNISSFGNMGLFEIYDKFVERKLGIYHAEKSTTQRGNQADRELAKVAAKSIQKMHRELAVRILFQPSCDLPELDIRGDFEDLNVHEILTRIGLVNSSGTRLEFVHRSYAEFFFGEYISSHLKDANVQSKFMSKLLTGEEYHLIRMFINGFLSKIKLKSNNSKCPHFYGLLTQNVVEEILFHEKDRKGGVLHDANIHGQVEVCLIILNNAKFNINVFNDFVSKCDDKGQTVLHLAASNKNSEVCEVIMKTIAEHPDLLEHIVTVEDDELRTALYTAAYSGDPESCSVILDAVATHPALLINIITKISSETGQTPLHVGAFVGSAEVCKVILKAFVKHPEALRVKVNQKNLNNLPNLYIPAASDYADVCQEFLQCFKEHPEIYDDFIAYWNSFKSLKVYMPTREENLAASDFFWEDDKENPYNIIQRFLFVGLVSERRSHT